MPNRVALLLNKNRRSYCRNAVLGAAVAASLRLVAGCNNTGTTGDNLDMSGGGGEPDLALPDNPPPGSFRVTVTIGTGTGSVTSQPGNISCGTGTAVCAADYVAGTQVVLTAAGLGGAVFSGWSGACAGQGAVCTLTVNADQATTANFGTLSCSPDGVCWEAPLPFGYDLNSVAAINASDAWAVGNSGAAVHYDGKTWTRVQTGTVRDLTDVWARSATDVWAAAGAGTMLRWDGTKWNTVTTGFPNDISTLVWGTANRVFVPTAFQFVLVYDGTNWTRQDTGTRNDTRLAAITGTANNDVWVLGFDRYITHYNGTNWQNTRPDPAANVAYGNYAGTSGVFSVSGTDIWEVTNAGYVARNNPPNFGGLGFGFTLQAGTIAPGAGFAGLWGTASNNLFTNGPGAMLYRYDGTKWNANQTGVKDVVNLSKVHGTSATDVWAVGQRGVIAHYDGAAATVKRGNIFSGPNMLGVWASSVNDAWFITNAGTVVHYDGAAFTESAPLVTGGGSGLRTIWGTGPNDIWVGGGDGVSPVFMRYDGKTWNKVNQAQFFNGFNVDTLYASSKTTAFATGAPSLGVQKWDGTTWKIDTTLSTLNNPISALWGSGDNNVLAIESASTKLWVYNGAAWTVDSRISAALYSLGGSGANDVWAGGSQAVWHFDGTNWTKTNLPTSSGTINSVSSVSATDAWAVDQLGATFHYDGNTWKQMDTGISTASVAKINAYSVNAKLTWLAGRGILSVRK